MLLELIRLAELAMHTEGLSIKSPMLIKESMKMQGMKNARNNLHNCRGWKMQGIDNARNHLHIYRC